MAFWNFGYFRTFRALFAHNIKAQLPESSRILKGDPDYNTEPRLKEFQLVKLAFLVENLYQILCQLFK